MSYLIPIKTAIIFFPFIALFLSIPFILVQYHKYGSISLYKALLTYSFVFYLICAYFLVILPLPKISEVALLTTPRIQLIPFKFIYDFINESGFLLTDLNTYLPSLKTSAFFVPLFNIFLTIPFGFYLHYFFKCDLKKTCLYSFLFSMFFELTQLSGLYFIYPRGYRLFDVDDLLLNTFGGFCGFFLAKFLAQFLPSIDSVNNESIKKGRVVSGPRRTVCLLLDFFLFLLLNIFTNLIFSKKVSSLILIIICLIFYYFILPIIKNCRTPAQKYLKLAVIPTNNSSKILRYILRNLWFIIIYFGFPYLILAILTNVFLYSNFLEIIIFIYILTIILYYIVIIIKYTFTSKPLLYEKLSHTKLISTIGDNNNE